MTEFIVKQQLMVQDFVEQMFTREEGQDMIEYALLAALIAVACIVIMKAVGTSITGIFTSVTTALNGA